MIQAVSGQRVDQWLWHCRLVKSRSLAAKLVESGSLRINREKITKPGHQIEAGDILTFMHADHLRVIEVVALTKRRGPAHEARLLYQSACEQSTHVDRKGDA